MPYWLSLIAAVLAGALAAGAAFSIVGRRLLRRAATAAAKEGERLLEEVRQRLTLTAKEELLQARESLERELSRRRSDLDKREASLEQHVAAHEERERELGRRDQRLGDRERALTGQEQEARKRLEQIAGLSSQEAKEELMRRIEDEARNEAAAAVRDIREQARKNSEREAKKIVALAIQRIAVEHTAESTVAFVKLPNDDMKGRIIGREGRNIRALEMATGVDVIVDETPQSIVLSSFDPLRRAVAQRAIERLIEDGRIHPGRIEEMVGRARSEMEESLDSLGESAAFDLGITGLPQRLLRLLGKLKYRVVLGYNLLDHSVEVARLASQMALLLGLQPDVVKRAALLHEIGQVEETRADVHPILVSADLAAKLGEEARVVQAIRALHGSGADPSLDAALLKVAEKAIVARPGEKDTNLQGFMERMRSLEAIASSFHGVSRAFVMRSGKEVRVLVEAEAVSDGDVVTLSKEITSRIQKEVEIPGAVRISVIRETRAVDYAT